MSSFTTLNKNNENARLTENDVKEFINRTRGELNKDKEKMDTLKKKTETLKRKTEDLKVEHIKQEKTHEVAKAKVKELGNQLKTAAPRATWAEQEEMHLCCNFQEAAEREEAMSPLAALNKKNENDILGPNDVEEVMVRIRGD
ncbi:hypothetical protein HAX54_045926 [Datura stramonium]|uniref:Uncharacterized protein n=1 Tax=Datura stramonium TaxID=4076 RepID=A0ABS8WGB0_DATST|nr:hypothetical protein [Datura stramonium]